jgi:glycosyltransferase involved in cell wall biosynthesis
MNTKDQLKLSILIPTFNRAPFLLKNLEMLAGYIRKGNLQKDVEIVVSNNQSTDKTDEKVKQFQNQNTDIQFQYYTQNKNIGLEKNALFVLKEAKGEYVMYLGDDDYIEFNYLKECFSYINDTSIHCIIPAIKPIDEKGNILSGGRDLNLPTKKFEAGYKNCLTNAYRGHQLSGLVLKRNKLHSSYLNSNVNNIYPFIFFVSLSCLYGATIHLTKFPTKVTSVPQHKKDWDYGEDGLINDIFDNYKKLPVTYWQKTKLQLYHYCRQTDRLWGYHQTNKLFFRVFINIWLSKNSTFGFKIVFPVIVFFQILKAILHKITK